jgi:hypothetical protein
MGGKLKLKRRGDTQMTEMNNLSFACYLLACHERGRKKMQNGKNGSPSYYL